MPFNQFIPRTFSAAGVLAFAPVASGVYGISNAREWIFVGETDNINSALLEHLKETDTSIKKRHPTGFVFEVCDARKRIARHTRLILEYAPTCNAPAGGEVAAVGGGPQTSGIQS